MNQPIRGILFDLGDTLVDFGDVNMTAMFKAGARRAYAYLREMDQPLPSFTAYYLKQLFAVRWRYLVSRLTGREFNSLEIIADLSGRMGQSLTPAQHLALAWLWYEPLSESATVEPGLPQTLARLADMGAKLGLISNTFVPGEVLDRHLEAEGLLDLLDIRVYSCNVRYRKPHKEIFRIALGQMGLGAGETMFVGDALKADIRGANRAGMVSVLKDPSGRHDRARIKPAYRVRKLAELPRILAAHNGREQ